MRRFLIGSIIALCMIGMGALHAATKEISGDRPVRLAPAGIQPAFEAIDRTQGLPSTTILEIVSDRHGFIWIAGDRGVHRFDGHNFFNLDRDPARPDTLESRYIYALAEASDAMWIGSPNGTLQRLDSHTGMLTLVPMKIRGVSPQMVTWLACDALGQVWQMSDLGLLRLDRRGEITWTMPQSFEAMAFSPDRTNLFVALRDHRVVTIDIRDPKRISTLLTMPEGTQGEITAMASDKTGLWLAVGLSLWRFDWATRALHRIAMPVPLIRTTSMVIARDGSVWLGSVYNEGLYRFDPWQGTLSIFRNDPGDPQSLHPGPVTALAMDRSGNLWIAQATSGLSRLSLGQTALSRYRTKAGKSVCAMGETEGSGLVAALCHGGLMKLNRETDLLEPMPASSALPLSSRALVSDREGGLWITSAREGLFHWRPDGSVRRFPLEAINPTMTGAFLDARQRLWVTHLSGFAVLEPGAKALRRVEAYEGVKPFVFDLTEAVSPGPNGSLWIGTMKGVLNFSPETGQVRRYQHERGDNTTLSDSYVLQTYTDKDGRLWVGTRAGLNRLTTDGSGRLVFRRYGLEDGLPDITIEAIVSDARGALWVGTDSGIARWDPEQDRFRSYLPADGIPDAEINMKSALLSTDGGLYFGTLAGLWRIDPQAIQIADPAPVVLSSYEAGDRTTVNLQGNGLSDIKAKYSDGRVVFRIAVLGDARRLSYRLVGLEDSWRDMPNDLTITYHWLQPGTYRLQVRQLQRDGRWGDPDLSLPIEITPPPWRTGWAYLLYAIVAIALLFALARAFVAWRHRALREQLKESHARLSVALHAARFGMWVWGVDTDEAEIDSYTRTLLAVPPGAPPLANIFGRMYPDDIGRVREQVDRALREDVAVDFEYRVSIDDSGSEWRWIEGHAAPYRQLGKSGYLIGVNRDASQRKHELLELEQSKQAAERALGELTRSRRDLAMALESGDLGVWRFELVSAAAVGEKKWTRDPTLDCDANVRRIFGWPEDRETTRRSCLRAVHPTDRRRVLAQLLRALTAGGSYADQYRIVHPDGQVHCIAVRAVSMLHADPLAGASLTGIVRDVTGEEALNAELQRAAEEAQQATESKTRFLAMMSHEIRTPINGVIGMVELLFETPMSEEQQQLLGICKDSAYVLLAIINDILDFSKIEAGKLKLEHTLFSPRRLVESVAESLRTQVAGKGIDLDVFVSRDVPRRLKGDRMRLRQVLTNLIGNAVKFTEKGGVRVYVSVAGIPTGSRHHVRFDVVDTGIGMDRRTIESLFQPFEQADAATTRRFGGTGLGLTIVKHLVTLMGGEVGCDSEVASGSRFSVVIPLESIAVDGSRRDYALPRVRVLALCESIERAILLRELCNELCVDVEIATSLDQLLQRLDRSEDATDERNLVLLDKGFAEDHEALCCVIRQRATAARIPIIIVRGDSQRTPPTIVQGVTAVAGSPLTSPGLARGCQLALGLASPVVPAIAAESSPADVTIRGESIAEAEILLAEDNATNREVIIRQLQSLGYACDVTEDGEQAWDKLQANRNRYRLLLTDCHMPRLDGYGLTERIRRDEAAFGRPHLNIVAITANALLGEGERCLALGMDAYLAKPLQKPDLKRILARMLSTHAEPVLATETTGSSLEAESGFAVLARLLGNNETRLHLVLDVFVTSTRVDLERWTQARHAADSDTLRELAHKLKSGCRQMGEESTAFAFEAVELHSGTAADLVVLAESAQRELELTLARVTAFKERSS
ncbi:MAG TPA: ATP-binding protein [Rhodanobacter sp.]|jgi:signal transduction histidine kinase/ligand-binding sensor domain-containing protein/DNA-binding response OmpR family regulator|nr:ATP-binding protein [Rhodanobacter sp.]